jgi:RES domain-containing protein
MDLWRIAAETRKYRADDLSGVGAAASPGRWNTDNEPVVYCSVNISLAVLETAAHIVDAGLPMNRFLVRIEVPDVVWAAREEVQMDSLPAAWSAIPAGLASSKVGSIWLASNRSPILLVPSVIVPEEKVALLNPRHPMAASIKATAARPFEYNKLFR